MRIVEPKVYLLAQTSMDVKPPKAFRGNLQKYLEDVGAVDWKTTPASDGEVLIEVAGRLCYKAFGLGLNNNISKVREGNEVYLANLAKQDHGSVQEHSTVTFLFADVSRILTHELVRHRVGVAISQESGRYVRSDDISFYMPECFKGESWEMGGRNSNI
jgi:thymidylate synthase (FAD)